MSTTRPASRDQGRDRLARVGLAPRGLDRLEAAAYVGVSATTFDGLVLDGRMPKGKRVGDPERGRVVWDRHALDAAFAALPDSDGRVATADDDTSIWGQARA